MPRDNDKNNDSRGRRDRPSGGKGRSGAARGPEKKFAKRGFAGKSDGDKRDGERKPYAGKSDGPRSYGKKPYAGGGKPYAGKRDGDAPRPRGDRPSPRVSTAMTVPAVAERSVPIRRAAIVPTSTATTALRVPIVATPVRRRVSRTRNSATSGPIRHERVAVRSGPTRRAATVPKAIVPTAPARRAMATVPAAIGRSENSAATRSFPAARPIGARARISAAGTARAARGTAALIVASSKPWQKRDASSPDHAGRNSRPPRDGARNFDKPRGDRPQGDRPFRERPKFDRPREGRDERPRGDRPQGDRPRFDRPRQDRPREDRPKFDRPREGGSSWQEHPRSDSRSERPRRDNEDDSKVFAKRPAFGGRGEYRERKPEFEKRAARPPREKKSGERIAKVLSRAGLASRRDAEEWVVQGRVTVNGRVINSPALDVTGNDVITIDGKPLPPRERTRLFMFHKPRGLMTTHADPEGRPTVFDNLPDGLPRLISIGRLDFNTEGLLLLTNDGGLARALELPDTGWLRRYRVRAHGEVTQAQLDELKKGVEVDGVKYGPIDATLERDQGANVWLVFAIREGKNREVRNVMAHLGLEVNRLIRVSYGPFQLGELSEGHVEEVKTRVLREQLGEKIAELAGADFNRPMVGGAAESDDGEARQKTGHQEER